MDMIKANMTSKLSLKALSSTTLTSTVSMATKEGHFTSHSFMPFIAHCSVVFTSIEVPEASLCVKFLSVFMKIEKKHNLCPAVTRSVVDFISLT